MKKKIATILLLTVLIIICVFGIGCSRASCTYKSCAKCGSRAAGCYEKYGSCVDKCDFLGNCFMGEACHDRCRVSCWYTICANNCRVGGDHESCGAGYYRCWDCYKDNLTYLSARPELGYHTGDYNQAQDVWRVELSRTRIKNLPNYFKLTATFYFTLPTDVKDLFIVFDMKEETHEPLYNYNNNVLLLITDKGKKGETVSASVTYIMCLEGDPSRYENNYLFRVTDFYGKVD